MIVEIAESRLDANLMKLVDNQVDYERNQIATSDAELDFYKDPTYLRQLAKKMIDVQKKMLSIDREFLVKFIDKNTAADYAQFKYKIGGINGLSDTNQFFYKKTFEINTDNDISDFD